jgi:8-oxo-dGTP diphosphatase
MQEEDCFHLGAKALVQDVDGKLLVLEKKRKGHHPNSIKQLWDLPGGRVQRNELLEDALKREVYEETGVNGITEIKPLTMVLFKDLRIPFQSSDVGLILAVYLCRISGSGPLIQLSDEHLRYVWAPPREAAELLAAGNNPPELIHKISQL